MAFVPTPPNFGVASFPTGPTPAPQHAQHSLPTRRRRQSAFQWPSFRNPQKSYVYIEDINLLGAEKLPDSVINKHLKCLERRRVLIKDIFESLERVNKWFQDNGYVCSRVFILQLPNWREKTLTLFSLEPRLGSLSLIAVDKDGQPEEGAEIQTRQRVISQALNVKIGDVFQWKPAGFASLMALGLFEYANAEVKIITKEEVKLIMYLRERPSGRVEPGAGMSSDGKLYGDVSINDNNFMGRAQRLRIEWQKRLDAGRSSGGVSFEDMRVGAKIPISIRFKAYRDSNSGRSIPSGRVIRSVTPGGGMEGAINSQDAPLRYEKDRDGVMVDLGYRPKETSMMFNFTPMLESVYPSVIDASGGTPSAQMVFQTAYTHATRLPIDIPRSGHLARVEQSVGAALATPTEKFHKTVVRLAQYFSIGTHASVAVGSTIGIGSENLPWHEQKSLGGPTTVRGYDYGALGRYKSFGHGRLELRVPLTPMKDRDALTPPVPNEDADDTPPSSKSKGNGDAKEGSKAEEGVKGQDENTVSGNPLDALPTLVGFMFGDIAVADTGDRETLGASYGVGMRIGGVISVNWATTGIGKNANLHFGLVDRSL